MHSLAFGLKSEQAVAKFALCVPGKGLPRRISNRNSNSAANLKVSKSLGDLNFRSEHLSLLRSNEIEAMHSQGCVFENFARAKDFVLTLVIHLSNSFRYVKVSEVFGDEFLAELVSLSSALSFSRLWFMFGFSRLFDTSRSLACARVGFVLQGLRHIPF